MKEKEHKINCLKCGEELNESTTIKPIDRDPCPKCNSRSRKVSVLLEGKVSFFSTLKIKGKRKGLRKAFIELIRGHDKSRKLNRYVEKERIIDRENDQYYEKITDPETGEVIHECKEPLSDHFGHGSAKKGALKKGGNKKHS